MIESKWIESKWKIRYMYKWLLASDDVAMTFAHYDKRNTLNAEWICEPEGYCIIFNVILV